MRKVQRDSQVMVDAVPYFLMKEVLGKQVALRVVAATRELIVEHEEREIKRVPSKGLGAGPRTVM